MVVFEARLALAKEAGRGRRERTEDVLEVQYYEAPGRRTDILDAAALGQEAGGNCCFHSLRNPVRSAFSFPVNR